MKGWTAESPSLNINRNCLLHILKTLFISVGKCRLFQPTTNGPISLEGYIVDNVNGDDNNSGENVDNAFKTIGRCAQSLMNPGDECQIRAGHYHEGVTITGLEGTADAPIKIVGYEE